MSPRSVLFVAAALVLTLAACNRSKEDAAGRIAGDDTDPAVTSALEDQILVDPALTQQSNSNAIRPTQTPIQAHYPPDSAAEQARLSLMNGGAGCGSGPFDHDAAWAKRLPAAFALPPGARLTEAAGNDQRGCSVRVVTFASADPAERVLAFYRGRALAAGYSAAQQRRDGDHVLAGTNPSGGHYYLIVTPTRAGSDVALIADKGA